MTQPKTVWLSRFIRMPSSLFTKIFLWFCIYVLTVFAAAVYISTTSVGYSSISRIVNKINKEALLLYGQTLVERYEEEGADAVARAVRRIESSGDLNIFFFDDQGNEALGRTPAELSQAQVQSLLKGERSNPSGGSKQIRHKIYMMRGVADKSGKTYIVLAVPKHNFLEKLLTKYTFSRLIIFLIVAGCFSYLLSRYLTNPIRALQTATQKLAMGNLSTRIGLQKGRRRDELGELARDFDLMAEKIEILEDVRRQFLSDISHELRSPLARLNLAVEMARKRNHRDISDYLERIDLESEKLNDIVDRLLASTRGKSLIETDGPVLIKLGNLIDEILKDANFEAQTKKCLIKIVSAMDIEIVGIRHLIKCALENVIYNAVRYTKEGTSVEISVEKGAKAPHSSAMITIRDHGNGVPEDSLRKIFQPFYRVDPSRDRQSGGTGLGLAIAERAIRYHHGTIAASNAPGGGLLVKISIPTSGFDT